jgi:hypothetical protein
MRKGRMLLLSAVLAVAVAAPATAEAAAADAATAGEVTVRSKITGFSVANGRLVANGFVTAGLSSGDEVVRDRARVRFRVAQQNGRRCDVLTLNLAPLTLELLGVRVQTSEINLRIYGRRGALLGDLVCALSRATVRLPRVASALNRRLDGRPLRVMGASTEVRAADHQGTCQVLRLVLGPLHLDLLGLNVDLFGENRRSPVTVTITALPGHGVLGDLLCGLAGGPTPAAPAVPAP